MGAARRTRRRDSCPETMAFSNEVGRLPPCRQPRKARRRRWRATASTQRSAHKRKRANTRVPPWRPKALAPKIPRVSSMNSAIAAKAWKSRPKAATCKPGGGGGVELRLDQLQSVGDASELCHLRILGDHLADSLQKVLRLVREDLFDFFLLLRSKWLPSGRPCQNEHGCKDRHGMSVDLGSRCVDEALHVLEHWCCRAGIGGLGHSLRHLLRVLEHLLSELLED
mmetsp:Transcript_108893/g.313650  ORF Transcript_108893/g.313650 Transcript_108893/m.313650 type:complete len:225 (+) Transcript_108893:57-731(+)